MELILVRHGETPFNRERKVLGVTDIELNDTGLRQTRQLALSLKEHEIRQIYSSPLKRAYKTAEAINQFHEVPIHLKSGLMEMNAGDFEGLSFEELRANKIDFLQGWMKHPAMTKMPNGESIIELQERAWNVIEEIIMRDDNVLVVSHNFTIAAILCKIRCADLSQFRNFCVETASKTIIHFMNGVGKIELFNDRSHLDRQFL